MYMLRMVEKFLQDHDIAPTKFGRIVAKDPRLVLDMRMGREVRPAMQRKIKSYIDGFGA